MFMISIIQSDESKILFNTFYRNLLAGQIEKYPVPGKFKLAKNQLFPDKNTVFDWVCDKKSSGIWIPWINSIETSSMATTKIDDLFIYTSDNAMQMYFLKLWFQDQQPSLILGPPGNGKTATMLHYLSHLPTDKYISNIINLSHYTSAENVQEMIMSKIDRRRKGVYGPSMGKKIILAFDDFERSVNSESTENIVELLRQLLERKFWYDSKEACRVELIDFLFTGAMAPPTNRAKSLFLRFVHHVNIIPSKPLNETIASSIFSGVLEKHLSNNGFSLQICQLSQVGNCTLQNIHSII
ncbi:dynein axonemal heavy chain 3-like [Planococcus citri]|uniref:dynein axonemal heavy chain 3-like n=1 Tax=Planococcus citri TaxID=170843 RepID=UPI0031F870C4